MWVHAARVLLLAAAIAAAVLIPSDLVVEVAAGVVAGLVLEVVKRRPPTPPTPPAAPAAPAAPATPEPASSTDVVEPGSDNAGQEPE